MGKAEDVALVSDILNCGGDIEIGTNQTKVVLWRKIKEIYDGEAKNRPNVIHERTMRSLESRWDTINEAVSLWVSQKGEAERMRASGMDIDNVEAKANELYSQQTKGRSFTFQHCYNASKDRSTRWKQGKKSTKISDGTSKRSSDEAGMKHCDGVKNDYFVDRPLYPEATFRRRFRMRRALFLRIIETVTLTDPTNFAQKPDATGWDGATLIQKCTAVLRMLAYGTTADTVDEYIKIAESTTRTYLIHFVKEIRKSLNEVYLRRPTVTDLQ